MLNSFKVWVQVVNEVGLAIGYTGFDKAQYPPKHSSPVVDQIQYITYLLDNFATTIEVMEFLLIDSSEKPEILRRIIYRKHTK